MTIRPGFTWSSTALASRACWSRSLGRRTPRELPTRPMKTRIVRVGNSRGVRLPKLLLQQARLADEVELQVKPGRIVIRALRRPRAGWAEAARQAHERGDDKLLDPPTPTRFDRREWAWR